MSSNEEFIRRNKVKIIDEDKNTRLHYASALGNLEEVKKILSRKQRIDPENYLGWTPLMMAVRNANLEIIELLIHEGADATKKNKFKMNVFLISVTCGDLKTVVTILNHLLSGGVSRRSLQRAFSPISLAILFGRSDIFYYLLNRCFDTNCSTPVTGITPLMFAAAMGSNKAIKRLLERNANPSYKNVVGQTAADFFYMRQNGRKERPPVQVPLIVISPQDLNPAHFQVASMPNLQVPPVQARRSSDVQSPAFLNTPIITPITPFVLPQVFFGPDFVPAQFIGTSPALSYATEQLLNAKINPSSYPSPVYTLPVCPSNYA